MNDATLAAPAVSVVIAASGPAGLLANALGSLAGQVVPGGMERIVVAAPERRLGLSPDFADVVRVVARPGASVPEMRRLGLDRARGAVVVLTEDSCEFPEGWADAWARSFSDPRVLAATGPVVPAMGDGPLDRAVFACEYALFLPERHPSSRPPARLAGNNFALRRTLAGFLDPCSIEEGDVPAVVASLGGRTFLVPGAVARHTRRYGLAEALRDRLRFGFGYGREQADRLATLGRAAGVFSGPAVLAAQAARLGVTALLRRSDLGAFLEAVPVTLALLTAWSVGEWLGRVNGLLDTRPSGRRRGTTGQPPARPTVRGPSQRPRCTPAPPAT